MKADKQSQMPLRSASCAPAVLEILIGYRVNSGFCAPPSRNLSSLATHLRPFLDPVRSARALED